MEKGEAVSGFPFLACKMFQEKVTVMREDIKSFIATVAKPGRYSGGETGSVFKDPAKVKMRVAFCFPDVYEIGMSNLGMRILCGCFNALDDVWCERVYAPWVDMAAEMEKRDIPLFTHESGDILISLEALPPGTGRSCITTVFTPLLAAEIAAHIPARPAPITQNSAWIFRFFAIFSILLFSKTQLHLLL